MAALITLQQALFGYDGGHQLIGSSVALPTEARHELAVATDLSGSAPPVGFEQAYTGMPVPGTEFYALFSTWLAPEMPRPGCVWSHVLLIELADIALLTNLAELRTFFRRPEREERYKRWQPIQFTPSPLAPRLSSELSKPDCIWVLQKLYTSPGSPAVIAAETSQTYEEFIFAVWSQQWPKLRRSFSFSTGSFADRGRSGPTFDLQITPAANTGAWPYSRNSLMNYESEVTLEVSKSTSQPWIYAALSDLFEPNERGFRSFLQIYGVDVGMPRAAFSHLATAFTLLNSPTGSDWADQLSTIGELFPKVTEALRLKTMVIMPPRGSSSDEVVAHAWQTAAFLSTNPKADAYTNIPFDYSEVSLLLWNEKRTEMIGLLGELIRREENPSATAFAEAIAKTVTAFDLKAISDARSELIPLIVSHNRSLAFAPETWQLPSYVQSHVFDVLDRSELSEQDWAQVLGAMFVAATHVSVHQVVQKAGSFAMVGAFRWLEDSVSEMYLPSEGWRTALSKPAEMELLGTNDMRPPALSLCTWCLSTESVRWLLSANRTDIRCLAEQPLDQIPIPLRTPTAFLLMTLGLRATDEAGGLLISRSFFHVHEALASGGYAAESWWLLSPELPFLGSWHDWDRCEKLRKAVHNWFQSKFNDGKELLQLASSNQQRKLAVRTMKGK